MSQMKWTWRHEVAELLLEGLERSIVRDRHSTESVRQQADELLSLWVDGHNDEVLRRLERHNDDDSENHLAIKALALFDTSKPLTAQTIAEQAFERNPADSFIARTLCYIHSHQDNHFAVLHVATRALQCNPDDESLQRYRCEGLAHSWQPYRAFLDASRLSDTGAHASIAVQMRKQARTMMRRTPPYFRRLHRWVEHAHEDYLSHFVESRSVARSLLPSETHVALSRLDEYWNAVSILSAYQALITRIWRITQLPAYLLVVAITTIIAMTTFPMADWLSIVVGSLSVTAPLGLLLFSLRKRFIVYSVSIALALVFGFVLLSVQAWLMGADTGPVGIGALRREVGTGDGCGCAVNA